MRNELGLLQNQRLTDTIHRLLRERILNGTFAPGEKLHIHLLSQQLGVSPTPTKGALALLAAEGLVQVRPRSGTFVAVISPSDIADVFAIRRALELLAAQTVMQHITDCDVQELNTLVDLIGQAESVDEHFRRNSDFHRRLVELSGNRKLPELYDRLNSHIHIALVQSRSSTWRSRLASEEGEHRAIMAALTCRDRAAFAEAIDRHLGRSRSSIVRDLGGSVLPEEKGRAGHGHNGDSIDKTLP